MYVCIIQGGVLLLLALRLPLPLPASTGRERSFEGPLTLSQPQVGGTLKWFIPGVSQDGRSKVAAQDPLACSF